MNRILSIVRCSKCNQEPEQNPEGEIRCNCPDQKWHFRPPTHGTDEEQAFLRDNGFIAQSDVRNDLYYTKSSIILHLYEKGDYYTPYAYEGESLNDFVKRVGEEDKAGLL